MTASSDLYGKRIMPDDLLNKRMTFNEWSDLLMLREAGVSDATEVDRTPWRCTGPCGQLMYGVDRIDGKNYPSPENTPAGLFISRDIPHVCHVCWELWHVVEKSPANYWANLSISDNKRKRGLEPGGNYLFT
jgi:hypothetical protein